MSDDSDTRVFLTTKLAVGLLPNRPRIHTFRNSRGGRLVGADWDRDKLVDYMARYVCELAGPAATEMHHGLVLEDDAGYLYIETDDAARAECEPQPVEAEGPAAAAGEGGAT